MHTSNATLDNTWKQLNMMEFSNSENKVNEKLLILISKCEFKMLGSVSSYLKPSQYQPIHWPAEENIINTL